ncbi:fimbrial protein [Shewanella fidelis]|uniref:Fimbrial protein n=1 Tax=Shewanella fidelis TaxID=173509 RepID=A0AAW8NMS9_9GAMM|nr:fimbrial protein [Shewanella fidelis]MDR8523821.1 fimbrial protein [Shewanella fidelis]MDW4810369.1 fimbrial protein [Shewanella fidelis]MDW4814514.1 fimbrial protein [Shewanella fidelis]MDW4818604.1 fimbrial protein [Shewanella fidelis]MDW4823743.1 fimbrial protein [Shewanella fidelis]
MMKLTKLSLICLTVASTGLIPLTSYAAPNDITFIGEVNANTCAVDINGDAVSPVVLLPTVSEVDLSAVGSEAGVTEFSININGCDGTSFTAGILFNSGLTDGAGNLSNTGTAGNVSVALTKDAGANFDFTSGSHEDTSAFVITAPDDSGSEVYQAKYRSEAGGATAGTVIATVNYAITYY